MSWTAAQIETLCEHWGSKRASEIGALIGKTGNAVIGKANRLNLPMVSSEQRYAWVRETRQEQVA